MLVYISLFSQVLTAFICILFYTKFANKKYYSFLLIFLLLIAVIECLGIYLVKTDIDSYLMTYLFSLFQNILILIIFKHLIKKPHIILHSLFIIFFLLWIYYFRKTSKLQIIIIGSFFNAAIFSLMYLRELLISDEIFFYKKLLPFWMSVGFLVFYLPSIPFFTLLNYMPNRKLFFIINILIILKNSFITYGLITCSREEKY